MGEVTRCDRCGGPLSADADGNLFCPACLLRAGLDDDETLRESDGDDAPIPTDPESIADYRILRRIGEGGMGVVYLAEQTGELRRHVALKVIKLGVDSRQVVARFRMEQQSLALMDHRGIARIFDAGTAEDGQPYFVMEYVDGTTITDYCDRNRLDNRQRIRLFLEVCHAVQHAHQRGVIHRDLKPSNILVADTDDGPQIKIIDFGVAKATEQRFLEWSVFTEVGRLVGTPVYMSPEQAGDSERTVDTRSDVYSLGVVLYELLVGTTPIDAASLRDVGLRAMLETVQRASFPTPSSRAQSLGDLADESASRRATTRAALSRQLRGELDWIVMRALERELDRRFRSPGELADDLRRYLDDAPVESGPPSATYRLRKLIRRHRLAFATAAAIVAGLIIAVVGVSIGLVRAQRAEAEAREQAEIAEATAQFLNEDLLEAVAPEKEGRDVLVLDIVDRAAREVDERFADAPRTRAAVHRALGRAYTALGQYERAEPHLAEALDLRRNELGEDHLDTAVSTCELGAVQGLAGRLDDGLDRYVACLETLEAIDAPVESRLRFRREQAMFTGWVGRADEAVERYEALLPEAREALGDRHETTIMVLHDLGQAYAARNEPDRGLPLVEEAIGFQTELEGAEHAFTLSMESTRADIFARRGDWDAAAEAFAALRPRFESVFGENHWRTMTLLGNEAVVIRNLGRKEEAAAIQKELIERRTEAFGPLHPSTLGAHYGYARTMFEIRNEAEAERHFRIAYEGRREVLGEDARRTINTLSQLAECESRLGRHASALKRHEEVLARKHLYPESLSYIVAAFHARYGEALDAAGRRDEAIAAWRESLRLYDLRPGERTADRAEVVERLERVGAEP